MTHVEMSHGTHMKESKVICRDITLGLLHVEQGKKMLVGFRVWDLGVWGFRNRGLAGMGAETHCNTLQHNATHCNTLQHNATHMQGSCMHSISTHYNSLPLQLTATHCNTLQLTATHCNSLYHTCMNRISHPRMSHGTHMNKSYHVTYE